MIRGTHPQSGSHKSDESIPEATCELGVAVGHNPLRHPMPHEHHVMEQLGGPLSIDRRLSRDEVCPLGQAVDHHKYVIVTPGGSG